MPSNWSGTDSQVARLTGQKTMKARPTTASSGIVASMMSCSDCCQCSSESPEADRWSPITHSRPFGTVMSNSSSAGRVADPARR